jgi:hypothetical protein
MTRKAVAERFSVTGPRAAFPTTGVSRTRSTTSCPSFWRRAAWGAAAAARAVAVARGRRAVAFALGRKGHSGAHGRRNVCGLPWDASCALRCQLPAHANSCQPSCHVCCQCAAMWSPLSAHAAACGGRATRLARPSPAPLRPSMCAAAGPCCRPCRPSFLSFILSLFEYSRLSFFLAAAVPLCRPRRPAGVPGPRSTAAASCQLLGMPGFYCMVVLGLLLNCQQLATGLASCEARSSSCCTHRLPSSRPPATLLVYRRFSVALN